MLCMHACMCYYICYTLCRYNDEHTGKLVQVLVGAILGHSVMCVLVRSTLLHSAVCARHMRACWGQKIVHRFITVNSVCYLSRS
jgi:hypothetical protein